MIRAGVIGLGVGMAHAKTLASLPGCSLVAVCDLDSGKLGQARETFPQVRTTAQASDLLQNPEINLVVVAGYDDQHAPHVVTLLQHGKHVFVEKPLCQSQTELNQIRTAWEQSKTKVGLGVNVVLRSAPLYRWLKEQIIQEVFGQIYAVDGDYLYGRLQKLTEGWRGQLPFYSVMQGGGTHMLDLLMWLVNESPAEVQSLGNRICTSGTAFQHPDFVTSTYLFPSGLVGRITSNFGCVHRHQHVLRIFGTKATFIYDDMGPRLHCNRDPALHSSPIQLAALPLSKGDLLADWVKQLQNDCWNPSESSGHLAIMQAVLAADQSLAAGGTTQFIQYTNP